MPGLGATARFNSLFNQPSAKKLKKSTPLVITNELPVAPPPASTEFTGIHLRSALSCNRECPASYCICVVAPPFVPMTRVEAAAFTANLEINGSHSRKATRLTYRTSDSDLQQGSRFFSWHEVSRQFANELVACVENLSSPSHTSASCFKFAILSHRTKITSDRKRAWVDRELGFMHKDGPYFRTGGGYRSQQD